MTNAPPFPWYSLQSAARDAGLNYTQLAEQAGISRQYVSHLANGKRRPTTDIVTLLANTLQVPIEQLNADVSLATSPEKMLDEVDGLVTVLHSRLDAVMTAVKEIEAKREQLQQLVQVPA